MRFLFSIQKLKILKSKKCKKTVQKKKLSHIVCLKVCFIWLTCNEKSNLNGFQNVLVGLVCLIVLGLNIEKNHILEFSVKIRHFFRKKTVSCEISQNAVFSKTQNMNLYIILSCLLCFWLSLSRFFTLAQIKKFKQQILS